LICLWGGGRWGWPIDRIAADAARGLIQVLAKGLGGDLSEPPTKVYLQGVPVDSSLDPSACWCGSPSRLRQYEIISELNSKIEAALRRNPDHDSLPQRCLHLRPPAVLLAQPAKAELSDVLLREQASSRRAKLPPPCLTASRLLSQLTCRGNMLSSNRILDLTLDLILTTKGKLSLVTHFATQAIGPVPCPTRQKVFNLGVAACWLVHRIDRRAVGAPAGCADASFSGSQSTWNTSGRSTLP